MPTLLEFFNVKLPKKEQEKLKYRLETQNLPKCLACGNHCKMADADPTLPVCCLCFAIISTDNYHFKLHVNSEGCKVCKTRLLKNIDSNYQKLDQLIEKVDWSKYTDGK